MDYLKETFKNMQNLFHFFRSFSNGKILLATILATMVGEAMKDIREIVKYNMNNIQNQNPIPKLLQSTMQPPSVKLKKCRRACA